MFKTVPLMKELIQRDQQLEEDLITVISIRDDKKKKSLNRDKPRP
jgi:hypothetical protein